MKKYAPFWCFWFREPITEDELEECQRYRENVNLRKLAIKICPKRRRGKEER